MLSRTFRSTVVARRIVRAISAPAVRGVQELQFNTVAEMLEEATKAYTTNPMFGTKVGNAYEWINYTDFEKEVAKFRTVLQQHKIGLEDKVAIISNNRVEWAVVKYASSGVGAQVVPM
jgi:long-chain acyl-CoA synthetase